MPYREVTMLETKELLRLGWDGMAIKTIAGYLGLDPKTVRRYVKVGREHGLAAGQGAAALTDEIVMALMAAFREVPGRPRGESWALCHQHRGGCREFCVSGYPTADKKASRMLKNSRSMPSRCGTKALEFLWSLTTDQGGPPCVVTIRSSRACTAF